MEKSCLPYCLDLDFPEALRQIREQHKLTQYEMASLLKVTNQTISEWERGRQARLNWVQVKQLLELCD